nr:MAG TPA: hypothetical protein [Caudoviricetes sp.]
MTRTATLQSDRSVRRARWFPAGFFPQKEVWDNVSCKLLYI